LVQNILKSLVQAPNSKINCLVGFLGEIQSPTS
jgi:hypothetical protein